MFTKSTFLILAITLITANAFAHTITCTKGKSTRVLEISHPSGEGKPPCEVKYSKDGAEAKVLYNAANDGSFCNTAAEKFKNEKLVADGYQCGEPQEAGAAAAEATPSPSPAPADAKK